MLVFIDTTYGSTFNIEVDPNDNVLDIKNKIEKSQGIPVSMQTLYHNGEPLLIDYLDLYTYDIVPNSRLFLVLPSQEDNNTQVLQPTEQSLAPSTSSFQDSLGEFQDWSATARSNNRGMIQEHDKNQDLLRREPFGDLLFGEDLPLSTEHFSSTTDEGIDNSSVFHKEQSRIPSNTEQSTIPSNTFGELLFGEDLPLSTEDFSNIKSFGSVNTTEESINPSNVFHTGQSTIPSKTYGDLMFGEDLPMTTEHFSNIGRSHLPASTTEERSFDTSNVFHTQQSTIPGDLVFAEDLPLSTEHLKNIQSTTEDTFINKKPPVPSTINTQKEVINVPDSPVKMRKRTFRKPPQRLRVMILPHSGDGEPVSKVPVSVMADENVEEIRKKLEKIRDKGELKLPEKGYFFIHKQNVLDDDQTFLWNGVAHGDTIEIFPGYVTKDGRTFGL